MKVVLRRAAQGWQVAREQGASGVRDRLVRAVARRLPPSTLLPVRDEYLLDVEVSSPRRWVSPPRDDDAPLTLAWVMSPPAQGSGGHTTLMRLIEFLERRGHRCRIYLDDRWDGDLAAHTATLRAAFPGVRAEVADVRAGLRAADVVLATSWFTAYAAARDPAPGARAYVVQDFEPWFLPRSAEYVFAENTYRLGMHGITAGRFLARMLTDEYGMTCDSFDFGADTDVYRSQNLGARPGVAFYAKPSTPRRAYQLGVAALTLLHRRRPDVEIHLFGEDVPSFPVPHVSHGVVSPAQLNALYNRCAAGLSLSLTNVSLIPWELLASGCIPVVNDAAHNREVLDNDRVEWAPATPHALADALVRAADAGRDGSLAAALSASVREARWDDAGAAVENHLLTLARTPRQTFERTPQ